MSLFGRNSRSSSAKCIHCIDVVNSYGAVLEAEKSGVGGAIDESKLPFDKALIKAAILDVAATPGITAEQVSQLKAGYLELASFRSNISSKCLKVEGAPKNREELAKFFEDNGDSLEENAEISKAIVRDMEFLNEEWPVQFELVKAMKNA